MNSPVPDDVLKQSGILVVQRHGQKIYGGPPENWGARPTPGKASELFIGNLANDCTIEELLPLCMAMGEVYELRFMVEFSGMARGYAFVHYVSLDDASRAIDYLNGEEIRAKKKIGVRWSTNNRKLIIGNIPDMNNNDLAEMMIELTPGIQTMKIIRSIRELRTLALFPSVRIQSLFERRLSSPRSIFAVVLYQSHTQAIQARRTLVNSSFLFEWAAEQPALPLKPQKLFDSQRTLSPSEKELLKKTKSKLLKIIHSSFFKDPIHSVIIKHLVRHLLRVKDFADLETFENHLLVVQKNSRKIRKK